MSEIKRGILAKVKVNPSACANCSQVFLPEIQASKTGAQSGWYPNMAAARAAIESNPSIDAAIKQCGSKKCPDCPFK